MNNFSAKNIIMNIDGKTELPYNEPNDIVIKDNESLNYGFNNAVQQLVDNDLYIQQTLEEQKKYQPGPEILDDFTIQKQIDNYKYMKYDESGLSVLQKHEFALNDTLHKYNNINALYSFKDGKYYVLANDGLYSGNELSTISKAVQLNNCEICAIYYSVDSHSLLLGGTGSLSGKITTIYGLDTTALSTSSVQLKYPDSSTNLQEIITSLHYDDVSQILYIGTQAANKVDGYLYECDGVQSVKALAGNLSIKKIDPVENTVNAICQLSGLNNADRKLLVGTNVGLYESYEDYQFSNLVHKYDLPEVDGLAINDFKTFDVYDVLATNKGIYAYKKNTGSTQYQQTILLSGKNVKSLAEIDGKLYASTTTGVFEYSSMSTSGQRQVFNVTGKQANAICKNSDGVYAVAASDGVYVTDKITDASPKYNKIDSPNISINAICANGKIFYAATNDKMYQIQVQYGAHDITEKTVVQTKNSNGKTLKEAAGNLNIQIKKLVQIDGTTYILTNSGVFDLSYARQFGALNADIYNVKKCESYLFACTNKGLIIKYGNTVRQYLASSQIKDVTIYSGNVYALAVTASATILYEGSIYSIIDGDTNAFSRIQKISNGAWQDVIITGAAESIEIANGTIYASHGSQISCIDLQPMLKSTVKTTLFQPGSNITAVNFTTDSGFSFYPYTQFVPDGSGINIDMYINVKEQNTRNKSKLYGLDIDSMKFIELSTETKPVIFVNPTAEYGIKSIVNVGKDSSIYTAFTTDCLTGNVFFLEHDSARERYNGSDTSAVFKNNQPVHVNVGSKINALLDMTDAEVEYNKFCIDKASSRLLIGTAAGIQSMSPIVQFSQLSAGVGQNAATVSQFDVSEYTARTIKIDNILQNTKEALYVAVQSDKLLTAATASLSEDDKNNKFDYAMLKSQLTCTGLKKAVIYNSYTNYEPEKVYIGNSTGISAITLSKSETVTEEEGSTTTVYKYSFGSPASVYSANSSESIVDFAVSPDGSLFVATNAKLYAIRGSNTNTHSISGITGMCVTCSYNTIRENIGIVTAGNKVLLFQYNTYGNEFIKREINLGATTSQPAIFKNTSSGLYIGCKVGNTVALFTSILDSAAHKYTIANTANFNIFNCIDAKTKKINGIFVQNTSTHEITNSSITDDIFIVDQPSGSTPGTIAFETAREILAVNANMDVHQMYTFNADDSIIDDAENSIMYVVKQSNKISKLRLNDLPNNAPTTILGTAGLSVLSLTKEDISREEFLVDGSAVLYTTTNIVACVKKSNGKYQVMTGVLTDVSMAAVSPEFSVQLVDAVVDINKEASVVMYIDSNGNLYYTDVSVTSRGTIESASNAYVKVELNGNKAFKFCKIYNTAYVLMKDGLYTMQFKNGIVDIQNNIQLDAAISKLSKTSDMIVASTAAGEYQQQSVGSQFFQLINTKTHDYEATVDGKATAVNNGGLFTYTTKNAGEYVGIKLYEYSDALYIDTALRELKPNIKGIFMANDTINVINHQGVWHVEVATRRENLFSAATEFFKANGEDAVGANKIIPYGEMLVAYGRQKTYLFNDTTYEECSDIVPNPSFIGIFGNDVIICNDNKKNAYYASGLPAQPIQITKNNAGLSEIYSVSNNTIVAVGGVYSYSNVSLGSYMKKINGSLANRAIYDICKIDSNQALICTATGLYWLRGTNVIKNQTIRPSATRFVVKVASSVDDGQSEYLVQYTTTKNGRTGDAIFLSQDSKFTRWKLLFDFVRDTSLKIKSVYKIDKYTYVISTTKGIYATSYKYELVDNFSGQTMEQINVAIANACKDKLSSHISEMHAADSFVTLLNNSVLPTDFSGIAQDWQRIDNECIVVENDIVEHIKFGAAGQHVSAYYANANALSDWTYAEEMTYIDKQYKSNVHELYINLPTTGTEYIPLPVYSNTKSDLSGVVERNSTHIRVLIDPEYFDIQDMLEVLINGNSLPLGMKNTEDLYGDEGKTFHSLVLPSIAKYAPLKNDVSASNMNVLSGAYMFEFRCFGSDAQAIKLTFKEKNKYTLKFAAELPAYGYMENQTLVVGETQNISKNQFIEDGKLFKCWKYVDFNGSEHSYPDCYTISSSFTSSNQSLTNNNGVELQLSAQFAPATGQYSFTNADTQIFLTNTDMAYLHDMQNCPYLSGGVELHGIVVDYGV